LSRPRFLSRLLGPTQESAVPLLKQPFELGRGGYSAIVGESHYQETLARTVSQSQTEVDEDGEERPCFIAILVREPTNAYDPRAVAVYSPAGLVGYAPRESEWCDLLDVLAKRGYDGVVCRANLTGGGSGKSWGAVLHAHPDRELPELT
jgi:hypothetical protein